MNERQEHTADVLGKLTVLGTIVLPMNIICGMWEGSWRKQLAISATLCKTSLEHKSKGKTYVS
jgi:hypothetical protein